MYFNGPRRTPFEQLPKLRTRVRFSSPAHNKGAAKAHVLARLRGGLAPAAMPVRVLGAFGGGPTSVRRRASAVDPGRDVRGQATTEFGPTSSGRFGPDRPDREDHHAGWISIRKRALRERPGSRP